MLIVTDATANNRFAVPVIAGLLLYAGPLFSADQTSKEPVIFRCDLVGHASR